MNLAKGSKTDLSASSYTVSVTGPDVAAVDVMAVLLDESGRVRDDSDFIFFNNSSAPGVELTSAQAIRVDLDKVPDDVSRVLIASSTEAQGKRFGELSALSIDIAAEAEEFAFAPPALTSETVLQLVALYRRQGRWKLDAIGQGYADGLAAFATAFGITVDEPEPAASEPVPAVASASPSINTSKVSISLNKGSKDTTAKIDLRKGDPSWVLTVGLEWDGRGAVYDSDGQVSKYGEGDLDVYFFCRNEITNEYVVISGDEGHRGDLEAWPHVYHYGDSTGPGNGDRPAVEQVRVLPQENGDLLVNIYQSVDNGLGAINKFGRPRCAIRYGREGADGLPGPDADEILVYIGNNKNAFWVTVAHIDVQDGILTVDGETRYSGLLSERMPCLDANGRWLKSPTDGPVGQSKKNNDGQGLTRYEGKCESRKRK